MRRPQCDSSLDFSWSIPKTFLRKEGDSRFVIQQEQLGKLLADNDILAKNLGDRISRLEKQNAAEHIELKNQNKFLVDQNTILIDKIELLTNQNADFGKLFGKINWSKLISPTESVHTQTELKTVDKEVNTFQTKTQDGHSQTVPSAVDKETNTRIINFNDSESNTDAPVTVDQDQDPKENIQYTSKEIQTVRTNSSIIHRASMIAEINKLVNLGLGLEFI